jgi:hypothetical protein
MPTLIVTINGPFAYADNYPQTGSLTLMAPMCSQHLAGISTIEEDEQYILSDFNCRNHPANLGNCKAHIYDLRINPGNVGPANWIGNYVDCPVPPNGLDPREWRFWLRLPKPDVLVAVNPVQAEIIVPGKQSTTAGTYAVGVRLIYKGWDGKPIPLWYCDHPAKNGDGQDVVFQFGDYGDDHALLEVEYTSPLRDDKDHEDAVDCFENLIQHLKLDWTIYIPPVKHVGNLESGKLNDCKAAIARVTY